MDIYITNLATNKKLQIPMLPQEIKGKLGNRFASYSVIKNGEVKLPSGTELDTYTWTATFPGARRKGEPYIRKWSSPKQCDTFFRALKAGGEKTAEKVKAKLLITGTKINLNVYLQDYSPTESGGYGDITYSVTFIRAKNLTIKKSAKAEVKKDDSATTTTTVKPAQVTKPEKRTPKPPVKTYEVKSGDCLWSIAARSDIYGNGAKYTVIRDANKALIAKHRGGPNMIWPGDVLKIP